MSLHIITHVVPYLRSIMHMHFYCYLTGGTACLLDRKSEWCYSENDKFVLNCFSFIRLFIHPSIHPLQTVYDVTAFATCEEVNLENLTQDLIRQGLYGPLKLPTGNPLPSY